MAVDSGVVEQLEAHGMGAVREEQGLCALELAMSGAGASGVVGMVPLVWPVLLGLMGGEVPSFLGGFKDKAGQQLSGQSLLAGQSVLSCAVLIGGSTAGRCRAGQLCCSECVVGWAGEAEA